MSSFRLPFSPSLLLAFSLLVVPTRAQTAAPPKPDSDLRHLDKIIVSASPDPKAAFDLAQGTAVLVGADLRRAAQSTLGETLAGLPGVSSTSYGPSSSRPIIRGLGGDRVRVLGNGVGALDASSVSPDHNTALEPLFASRIEVLRGPSTLLYGSSAIGGAVNVIDNRIPESTADSSGHGALELRAGGPARERTGVLSAGFGADHFALQLNALQRTTRDLAIPGVARSDDEAPARQPRGTLPGSDSRAFSGSLGGAYGWKVGRAGLALGHYETVYGVPTGDDPATSINLKQKRLDFYGEITQPFAFFRSAQARLGVGDYNHAELSGGKTVNTLFKNRALEGRVELLHVPIGEVTGTVGLQTSRSDFSADGEEVVTPPSLTETIAIFAVEELKLSPLATLQFGARIEGQSIRLGTVEAALPRFPGYSARSGQEKKFGGASASFGAVLYPVKDWSLGTSLAYTERAPTAQELFSNGPHGGTGSYEVGNTGLGHERSLGFEVSLRRRAGFVAGSVSLYANHFKDFIYEEELPANAIPAKNNPDGLTPYRYVAKDAEFYGAEGELTFHLYERATTHVHLTLLADTVRATQTTEDTPLPRIAPAHFGAKLAYEDGTWSAGLDVRRAQRQPRITADESATPGYTLVHASIAYLLTTGAKRVSYELFAHGTNLGNATAREHTSFLKDFAPLPGRGVRFGLRVNY